MASVGTVIRGIARPITLRHKDAIGFNIYAHECEPWERAQKLAVKGSESHADVEQGKGRRSLALAEDTEGPAQ
jgi:hypothetical protein